jgi:exosortase H (IPTLxxWG-CTERM-specific)
MRRFFVVFVALTAGLFALELTPPGQQYVVGPWTRALATLCASLATVIDANVAAAGNVLLSKTNGFAVSIEAGCNGVEATLVLLAAIVAYPAPWSKRAVGLAAGIAAVQALNVVRVISLFYIGQWDMRAFEWAHRYAWQALIMLDVLVVWLIWVRTLGRRRDDGPAASGGGSAAPASA